MRTLHTTSARLARRLTVCLALFAIVFTVFGTASAAYAATPDVENARANAQNLIEPQRQAADQASIQTQPVNIQIGGSDGTKLSTTVQVFLLLTVLAIVPSILIMTTGFTRILIVLGFLRNALGTPQMPPNQVLIGISLFLTMFVMAPTFQTINKTAIKPYTEEKIDAQQAIKVAQLPIREFMFRQVDEKDLATFVDLADIEEVKTRADVPTWVLVPAFLVSELKTAFTIGFLIFIPFLIIDMVVASTLMSMGMIMLPPVMISLPFKILLFVLVDGWDLLIESLVRGFGT